MRLPATRLPVTPLPSIKTPPSVLPEITLPAPVPAVAVSPPIVLFEAPLTISTPVPLGSESVPEMSMPM